MPITGQALEALKAMDPFLRGAMPALKRDPSDMSIGTGNFTQGLPAFWFARGVGHGSSENLYTPYADSAWVRSAIQKISGPVSSCEVLFSRPSQTKVRRQGRAGLRQLSTSRGIIYRAADELLDLPQITEWLKEPVRDVDYQSFVEASIGWLKMSECFWVLADAAARMPFPEVSRNPYGQIVIPDPSRMRPSIQDGEIVQWTMTRTGGSTVNLDPSQVVRLRGWNPYDDHRGLGDYRAAHIAAEADWLAGKFSRNLMANNGDTSRIISVKGGNVDDKQRAQLIAEFKARRQASLRGESRDVVVGGDVELVNAELASVDDGYIQQRIENRHEIYNAFGVPMSMADIKASYSIGSASDMFQLLINTCIPSGAKFCGALEKLILVLTGERVEVGLNWDEHPCMQEVRKERLDSIAKLAAQGMPMEEINEYLALGLVKYPGWDVGYMPINMTPVLNEAGEVNPAPTPGEFSEPIGDDGGQPGPLNDGSDTPADGDAPEVKAMLAALRQRSGGLESAAIQYKSSAKNKALWEQHMRLRSKSVKLYQSKASKLFLQYRATALRHLEQARKSSLTNLVKRSLTAIIFDQTMFGHDLVKSLDPVTDATLQTAGTELLAEIGRADDPWKFPPQDAKKFIQGRENLIKGVSDTAFNQLKTSLQAGLDKGETTEELAGRVKTVFNHLGNFEARRIAMTETSAAYGYSRRVAMESAGIEYKAWLTSHGDNVRFAHEEAEENYGPDNPIPIDAPFIVDGEELQYPGDPNGSPGNVINCHCVQIAVQAPGTEDDED